MKRRTVVFGVVIIAVLIIGVLAWRNMTASSAADANRLQTVTVQRGNLVATVNAAGNVSAPQDAALAFQTTGRVTKVDVQVGDSVKQGQVLMELDPTDLQLALKTAQDSLASAEANYSSAQAQNSQGVNQLIVAKAALDKAFVALQQAQSAYNAVAWRGSAASSSQAAALANATSDYSSARASYQITASQVNDTALRSAQAQLDNAQVAVQQAQRNLDDAKLVAPFEGVVSAVNFSVGDGAGATTAVEVVDLSQLEVKVTVAEVDIPRVKVGESAQMTLDALPDKTYNAQVKEVGPEGTITQGVVNYPVTVAITNADSAIKPGMTANLAVVVDSRSDVLVVPTRAVRTQGAQKIVTVLSKGQLISVPIGTGLSNDQYIEVTKGLQEGDVVVVSQTQAQGGNVRGLGVPGFIGIPGGR